MLNHFYDNFINTLNATGHLSSQLIACVSTPNLVKYGFEAVLKPFTEDANRLSESIYMCVYVHI